MNSKLFYQLVILSLSMILNSCNKSNQTKDNQINGDSIPVADEPSRDEVEKFISQSCLPGVKASDVKFINIIDGTTKTGRVSANFKVERMFPTYRIMSKDEVIEYLISKKGYSYEQVNLLPSFHPYPTVYCEDLPAGVSSREQIEFRASLSVTGWQFSGIRVGDSFSGAPTPPDGSVSTDSQELNNVINAIQIEIDKIQNRKERRMNLVKQFEKYLSGDQVFRLNFEIYYDITFSVSTPIQIEDGKTLKFSATLNDVKGFASVGSQRLKEDILSANIVGQINQGYFGQGPEDMECSFRIEYVTKSGRDDTTGLVFDGETIEDSDWKKLPRNRAATKTENEKTLQSFNHSNDEQKKSGFINSFDHWIPEVLETINELIVSSDNKNFKKLGDDLLLQISGKGEIKIATKGGDTTISGTEWLLDCLFRPKIAKSIPCIRIPGDIAKVLALTPEVSGPDIILSYDELADKSDPNKLGGNFRNQILTMSEELKKFPEDDKSAEKIVAEYSQLAQNIRDLESLFGYLQFATFDIPLGDTGKKTRLTDVLATLVQSDEELRGHSEKGISDATMTDLPKICRAMAKYSDEVFAPIPVNVAGKVERITLGECMSKILDREKSANELLKFLVLYQELAKAVPNSPEFVEKLKAVVEIAK